MMRQIAMRQIAAAILVAAGAAALAGCAAARPEGERTEPTVRTDVPPPYEDVARRYNENLASIRSFFSRASIRLTYFDQERSRRVEQGEGTVQVILPDRLAMSINKAGKRLFWFGGDDEQYWWFDLVEARVASIGRHENFDLAAREQLGLAIHPLDLIRVLGIQPLPLDDGPGATQWSEDGRLLGVTSRIRDGGYQRLWLDPTLLEARKIELFDAERRPAVVADLEMHDYMPIAGVGGGGPRVARRVSVLDIASGTEVRLTMDEPEDGARRISQDAFDFEALQRTLGVERVIDLDAPQAMGAGPDRAAQR